MTFSRNLQKVNKTHSVDWNSKFRFSKINLRSAKGQVWYCAVEWSPKEYKLRIWLKTRERIQMKVSSGCRTYRKLTWVFKTYEAWVIGDFFSRSDHDRRSLFVQKIAGRKRSQNSAIKIAKNALFLAIVNAAKIMSLIVTFMRTFLRVPEILK